MNAVFRSVARTGSPSGAEREQRSRHQPQGRIGVRE
jgi:hypothetical protein